MRWVFAGIGWVHVVVSVGDKLHTETNENRGRGRELVRWETEVCGRLNGGGARPGYCTSSQVGSEAGLRQV